MRNTSSDSRSRILAAARAEFLEYGYEKASMRRIGDRCGLSAAGIYRHCRDKEDLYNQVIGPAAEAVRVWVEAFFPRCHAALLAGRELSEVSETALMREVVFPRMDDYHRLLTGSQGTRHEGFLYDLTRRSQEAMNLLIEALRAQGKSIPEMEPETMHMLISSFLTAMFEPVILGYPPDKALHCLEAVDRFFLPGWNKLLDL